MKPAILLMAALCAYAAESGDSANSTRPVETTRTTVSVHPVPDPPNLLTNEGIVTLVQAGFSDDFVLELIYLKQTRFETSADALAYLAGAGVSPRLIRYIVANARKEAAPEEPVRTQRAFVPVRVNDDGVPMANPIPAPTVVERVANASPAAYPSQPIAAFPASGFQFRVPTAYTTPVYPAYYKYSWWSGVRWVSYWP